MMARPIAHRGLHACGGPGPLENTVAAALAAIEAGYGIECDVRFARDGTPMVIHDATLARLAKRTEAIAELDAAAISAIPLHGGFSVPTLETLLTAVAGRVALVIEIKSVVDPGCVDAVLAQIECYAGPVAVESFDPAIVSRCRHAPCPVGLVGPGDQPVDATTLPRCDFLSWNVARLDALTTTSPLTTWTVRSPHDAACAAASGAQIVFEGWRP